MSCDRYAEALSALVDAELDPAEETEVRAHLAGCAQCRERFDALDRAAGLVGALGKDGPKPDFLERLDRRLEIELEADGFMSASASRRARALRRPANWWRRAAAVAAITAGAVFSAWIWLRPEAPGSRLVVKPPDAVARPEVSAPEKAPPKQAAVPDTAIEAPRPAVTQPPLPPAGKERRPAEPAEPSPPPSAEPAPAVIAEEGVAPKAAAEEAIRRAASARPLVATVRNQRRPLDERVAAVFELARLGGPEAAECLGDVLLSRSPALAPLADETIRALSSYPSLEGLTVLLAAAAERPDEVRLAMERVTDRELLGRLGRDLLPRLREPRASLILAESIARARAPDAGVALVPIYREAKDRVRRERLLLALGEAGDEVARKALLEACVDRLEGIRAAALRGLGQIGASDDSALFAQALATDASPLARSAAATALGRYNDPASLEALLAARGGDRSRRVQGAALLALQRATGEGLFAAQDWRSWRAARGADFGRLPKPLHPKAVVLAGEPHPQSYHGIPVVADGVVFLLDVSDSMRHDGKLERARRELVRTLRELPAGTLFQVGVFARTAQFLFAKGPVAADRGSVEQACDWIERRSARGDGTNFESALRSALATPEVDQIFILTDGAPTVGKAAETLIDEIRSKTAGGEVAIHALGLYDGTRPFRVDEPEIPSGPAAEFLRRLARVSGGVFLRND